MKETIVGYKALTFDPNKPGLCGWYCATSPELFRNLGAACMISEVKVELEEGYILRERQRMIPAICEVKTNKGYALDYIISQGLGKIVGFDPEDYVELKK